MIGQVKYSFLIGVLMGAGCSGCFEHSKPTDPQPRPAAQSVWGPTKTAKSAPADNQALSPRPQQIRRAILAGSWYPADRVTLTKAVDEFLAQAKPLSLKEPVIALISPHAGYSFSGRAAAAGYKLLVGQDVRRVILLAVSHQVPFFGASIPEATHYETPLGLIPVDQKAVAHLRQCPSVHHVPETHQREHSLEIQLPILQRVLPRFQLVPLVLREMGEHDYRQLATALTTLLDEHTVIVASSDFTHRGPNYRYEVPAGPDPIKVRLARLDQGAIDAIFKLSRQELLAYHRRTKISVCGLHPIALLLDLLAQNKGTTPHLVTRYTSGDVSGDWQSTVSYVSIAFTGHWPKAHGLELARSAGARTFPLSTADRKTLLYLARAALDASVKKGGFDPHVLPPSPPASLQRNAGAFVTLKCQLGPAATCIARGDGLRGCIGTIAPVAAVFETVARRAASAALEDRRFPRPVGPDELKHITVEVSVLTPPRKVSGPQAITIGQHGIILNKDGRSATFLPQVAPEQGWNKEETLRHLATKAGLPPEGWRDGAELSVYEAIVFSEETSH